MIYHCDNDDQCPFKKAILQDLLLVMTILNKRPL